MYICIQGNAGKRTSKEAAKEHNFMQEAKLLIKIDRLDHKMESGLYDLNWTVLATNTS